MARRIVSARDQVEMLSPWRTAAENPAPPSIHDIMPGRFSDGNGRWDYRHQETSGNSYLRHEYGIHPVTSPASHSYVDHRGKTHTVHYDPALTGGQLPRPGKWGHEWENPDAVRNKLTDLNPPPGMLWRGMSREEYERSRDRGYFESEGDHNFDSQQGLTFFSTKPEQAENYATWFAPQAYKPTFTHPGYVVGIPDRPDAPRGAIPGENEIDSTEVGLPGRIPFSEATHHYVGQVSTLTPGSQGVSEGWHGWEESGGSHPSSNIVWSQVHPGQHTAARRLAERADDLRWERSFDGGGGWILVTRTPDGNPVTIATSPTRGQRTAGPRRRFNQDWQQIGFDLMPVDAVAHYMQRKEEGFGDEKAPLYEQGGRPPLSQQIKERGYEKPVHLVTDGRSGSIYDGHHRIDIARQLGHTHIPVEVSWRTPHPDYPEGSYGNRIEPWLKGWLTDMRRGRETVGKLANADVGVNINDKMRRTA